jgi:MYXO-CTERM domain-containing protein
MQGTCIAQAANGTACNASDQCATGFCVEGVCCDTACTGTCQTCLAANKSSGMNDGVCENAKAGIADSHDNCADQGVAMCQHDGLCDGSGHCSDYPMGTPCGPTTCVNNVPTGYACNGTGTCLPSMLTDCMAYACSNGACNATCTTDQDCASTAYCDAGVCKTRGTAGKPCSSKDECASMLCVDGYCCNAPCSGQCEACNVPQAEGTCVPVSGNPIGARPACMGATSGNPCSAAQCDGTVRTTCNGFVGPQTSCGEASCTNGVATLAGKCDGKGVCQSPPTETCGAYACDATTMACKTECASDSDCASANKCDVPSKKCVSGASCDGMHTVTSPTGQPTDCTPYACEGDHCKVMCQSVNDCVAPFVCDPSGACVQPSGATGDSGGCNVTAGGERSKNGAWLLALGAAVIAIARRRRA